MGHSIAVKRQVKYADFFVRGAALMIDGLVIYLAIMLALHTIRETSVFAVLSALALFLFSNDMYSFVCHAIYGQTLGKKVMNIKVIEKNGNAITWHQSLKRQSVGLAFASFYFVSIWLYVTPQFYLLINVAYFFFIVAELSSMLFSRRERTVHDKIGGTVVIHC